MSTFFSNTVGLGQPLVTKAPMTASPFNYLSGLGDSNMEDTSQSPRWLTGAATTLGVTEINGGISGSCLCNAIVPEKLAAIARWRDYVHANGKYVVAIGTNDLNNGGTVADFSLNYISLLDQLLLHYLPTDIILCSIPYTALAGYPSWTLQKHLDFNTVISGRATAKGTKFCDFYGVTVGHDEYYIADHLHFNQTGHNVLRATAVAAITG